MGIVKATMSEIDFRKTKRRRVLSGALTLVLAISATSAGAEDLVEDFRSHLLVTDIFQPELGSVAIHKTEVVLKESDPRAQDISGNRALFQGVPYFQYWQHHERTYLFHPMALGLYLLNNASVLTAQDLSAVLETSVSLPNGGRAFYYPKQYKLARFLTPYYQYSALAMGDLLTGFIKLHQAGKVSEDLLRQVWKSMTFPYAQGGVNLADRVFLEVPIWGSPPEIVLNGWLYTLLRVAEYARYSGDAEARRLLASNLAFLAQVLPSFDDEARQISRYSNSTPYQATVVFTKSEGELTVDYQPHVGLEAVFPVPMTLALRQNWSASSFDTQIRARKGRSVSLSLTLGAIYDTVLQSTTPFTVKLLPGVYDPLTASPRKGGEPTQIRALQADGLWIARLDAKAMARAGFFLGYPTNFSKNGGENYYHVLHVVGLRLLAEELTKPELAGLVGAEVVAFCEHWADKWERYTHSAMHVGRRFPAENDDRQNTLSGSALSAQTSP